ncbi:predicted protein [Nematostella vectensis]|uniref:Lipoxygenase domain-containing protein n=1 Tax=Nematostella vectensis TaxID=45351 RepID=A7S208_NEMVE|nr:predicted protein [Nematostella vectensis]|eukprot:XP_001634357.1 predicted protein [Nematostella vectensis]
MTGNGLLVWFLVLVVSAVSAFDPVPDKGENVCSYDRHRYEFAMRRNVTSLKRIDIVSCGLPGSPDMQCEQIRYETTVSWFPVRRRLHFRVFNCCPGWRGYEKGKGCKEEIPCEVSLPQRAPHHCRIKRAQGLTARQGLYKLGSLAGLPFALGDMEAMKLVNISLADPFTNRWMSLYIHMLRKNLKLMTEFVKTERKEFTTYKEYEDVYYYFLKQIQEPMQLRRYFRFPYDTLPFKSTINNHTWREDQVFSEMRLAGLNPMCLTKVTGDHESNGVKWSELRRRLNPQFDWEKMLQVAASRSAPVSMIINDGSVFVCQFPEFDNLPTVPDIMEARSFRRMWKPKSPIALFMSRPGRGGEAQVVPLAIQLDSVQDSPVYTPEDGDLWTLAKESFEVTDYAYVEMVEHLLKTHLMMEPFCVTIKRHLATDHPLQQILRYHCRGLLPTNKIGLPKLVDDKAYMHQLFAIGNSGAVQLLVRAYMTMTWKDTDFRGKIRARGMDDTDNVPYFPYRDDGELIYAAIEKFVGGYLNHYYGNDRDVEDDHELQAMANEMSASGRGVDGGKGKLRGFPAHISSIAELQVVLTRLIWTSSGQHAAVNYAISAYGAYTPSMPTKIYDDQRIANDKFDIKRLPNANLAAVKRPCFY